VTAPTLRQLGASIEPFPRAALEQHSVAAARALLGGLLVTDVDGVEVVARIVETEAYREDDPASHSHAQRTTRSEPMFWRAGTSYVYRSYGVHWCVNVAVERADVGAAVLVRAGIVLAGEEAVRARRPTARRDRDLLRGPGNLSRGLAISGDAHDRGDLVDGVAGLRLGTDGWRPPTTWIETGPRVGVRLAAALPWRCWLHRVPEVSRYTRSPRAPHPDPRALPVR
jgi:DNA-3-methyladenine glycosylase